MSEERGKTGHAQWFGGRSSRRTLERIKANLCSELGQFSLILNFSHIFTQQLLTKHPLWAKQWLGSENSENRSYVITELMI